MFTCRFFSLVAVLLLSSIFATNAAARPKKQAVKKQYVVKDMEEQGDKCQYQGVKHKVKDGIVRFFIPKGVALSITWDCDFDKDGYAQTRGRWNIYIPLPKKRKR